MHGEHVYFAQQINNDLSPKQSAYRTCSNKPIASRVISRFLIGGEDPGARQAVKQLLEVLLSKPFRNLRA